MKLRRSGMLRRLVGSPPTRGAWIEISVTSSDKATGLSPPTRGAWIEIIRGDLTVHVDGVAPHTGGVD